ncbi:sesquipedalian-1 [Bombina bombina]|uniref:sesquipedalian-1 n=1 Tax=Bombina bombina TaxID=8345 RepID=UPI00235B158A|nr:sesquipedalian-1 [Bombina bombina]
MKLKVSSHLAISPPDKEGYLLKKGGRHTSYQKRWFWLRGNVLLYWERKGDQHPPCLILLEGSSVSLRHSRLEYAFSLYSVSRVYNMAAECQKELESWVRALLSASLGYTQALLIELKGQYLGLTGATGHTEDLDEVMWRADFRDLHHWLGKEIQELRKPNLINM